MENERWTMDSALRLRVPGEVMTELDRRAREAMLSRSDVVRRILAKGLGLIGEPGQARQEEDDLHCADGQVA